MGDHNLMASCPNTYKEFLLSILDYLSQLTPDWETEKILIGGTMDSNQSLCERELLLGRLGVIAESFGYILIKFLSMIIDDHNKYILYCLEDIDEIFTMTDAVKCLAEDNEGCNTIHPRNEKSSFKMVRVPP